MTEIRRCPYCGKSLIGTKLRLSCRAPECVEKKKAAQRIRRNEAERARSRKEKEALLKLKPQYCEYCGKPMTGKDNLTIPACHRPECQNWWAEERTVRAIMRTKKANKHRHDPPKTPKKRKYKAQSGDYSQAVYEREEAERQKPNGWICKYPGCSRPLTGPNRYWCDVHKALMQRKAEFSRCDGDFIYDNAGDGMDMFRPGGEG